MSESNTVPSTEGKANKNYNGVVLYVKASVVENEKGLYKTITEDGHIMDCGDAMLKGTSDMKVYTPENNDEYNVFKKDKMDESNKNNKNYVKECIINGNTENNPDYNVARATLSEEEFAKIVEEAEAESSKVEEEEAQVK